MLKELKSEACYASWDSSNKNSPKDENVHSYKNFKAPTQIWKRKFEIAIVVTGVNENVEKNPLRGGNGKRSQWECDLTLEFQMKRVF